MFWARLIYDVIITGFNEILNLDFQIFSQRTFYEWPPRGSGSQTRQDTLYIPSGMIMLITTTIFFSNTSQNSRRNPRGNECVNDGVLWGK